MVTKKSKRNGLARALSAVRDDRPADALEVVLEAWAEAPSAEINELVQLASGIVRTAPPEICGKTKRAIAAWSALGRAPRAADVPALLDSLADVLWRDGHARLAMIRRWRPDPRVDEALVRLLETLPYRSTSKPFYTELIDLATRIRDPALVARIENARKQISNLMSPTLGDWLVRRVDELLDELRPQIVTPRKPPAATKQLHDALVKLARDKAPRAEIGDLLEAIYDQPDDLGRRLVYADALLERGDPRGELITLQCQAVPTPEQQRRIKALVKAHGLRWLDELGPILAKGWKFERGFLAECRVDSNKGTRIRPLIGHPAWCTVHTLADSAQIALHPVMRSLRSLEFRPNRTRQREGLDTAWRELLAGTPRAIECLRYTDLDMYEDREEQVGLLGHCSALPALRQLFVGGSACFYADELFRAPIAKRIETLGLMFEQYDQVPTDLFGAALRASPIRRVVVTHDSMTVIVERGARDIERAHIDVAGDLRQARDVIGALPPTLRELRVTTPANIDRGALLALSVAARSLPALEVREIGPMP
jgi:uncharacterized protein (TIGR02996 family)